MLTTYVHINEIQHRFAQSGRMAVDAFFVMGAMLQTISVLKGIDNKNLRIFRMLWKRYVRYTPAVMGAMFLQILQPLFMNVLLDERPVNIRDDFKQKYFMPLVLKANLNLMDGYFW
jgi:peptidoglycan/LPS O-acetylase OafA/YrhL